MYQQIVLIGNVGNKDPETRKTPSGIPVANFSMATNRTYTDARGEKHTKTVWFRITAWHKLAEIVEQHVKAGTREVVGRRGASGTRTDDDDVRVEVSGAAAHRSSRLGERCPDPLSPP